MTPWQPAEGFRLRGQGRQWFERILAEQFGGENIIEPPLAGLQPPLLLSPTLQPVVIINPREFQSNPTPVQASAEVSIIDEQGRARGVAPTLPLYTATSVQSIRRILLTSAPTRNVTIAAGNTSGQTWRLAPGQRPDGFPRWLDLLSGAFACSTAAGLAFDPTVNVPIGGGTFYRQTPELVQPPVLGGNNRHVLKPISPIPWGWNQSPETTNFNSFLTMNITNVSEASITTDIIMELVFQVPGAGDPATETYGRLLAA